MLKTGARLESQVCDTQIIVVKTAPSFDDLHAGGAPMVPIGAEKPGCGVDLDPAWADGNEMGRRYVDPDGGEILVTRAGEGTLAVGDTPLTVKEAKPLPASD